MRFHVGVPHSPDTHKEELVLKPYFQFILCQKMPKYVQYYGIFISCLN